MSRRAIPLAEAEAKEADKRKKRPRFKVIHVANIDFDPTADAGGLVDGLLPTTGVAQLYGRWKSFKSFVALDLGWAVAKCSPTWAGHAIKRRGAVVYVACEGQGKTGMHKRIAAYKLRHGAQEMPLFYLIEARPDFGRADSADVKDLQATIRAALRADVKVVLLIIDTLVRTLHGKDENGEGMRNFLDNAEDLSSALDCLVVAVHHEGGGDTDRSRGSTVLPAGVVATWHVKKQPGDLRCTLTVKEAKDSVSDHAFDVTLEPFEFGDEHSEHRASTLVVKSIDPQASAEAPPRRERITPTLRAFMTSFDIGLGQHGQQVRLPNNGPRVRAVAIEALRPVYYGKRADLDAESKRKAFVRQIEAAIERELLVSGTIDGVPMLWRATKP